MKSFWNSQKSSLALFFILILIPEIVIGQRRKHPDKIADAEKEYDKSVDSLMNVDAKLTRGTKHSTTKNARSTHSGKKHYRGVNKSIQKSGLGWAIPAVEEETYFSHRPKQILSQEKRLFEWDDEVAPEAISEALETKTEKSKNKHNKRKLSTRKRNRHHMNSTLETSTKHVKRHHRKNHRQILDQSGYESVAYPLPLARDERRDHHAGGHSRQHGTQHSGQTTHERHQSQSGHERLQSYPDYHNRQTYPGHHSQHQPQGPPRTYPGQHEQHPVTQSPQHSYPGRHDTYPGQHHQHVTHHYPYRPRGPTPPTQHHYPGPGYEATPSPYPGHVWANRTVEGGSYYDKDIDDTHSPHHTGHRQPPGEKPSTSLDIDTLIDRQAIYGKYSPGDLQDLGIRIEDLPTRNVSTEDQHPFSVLYRPGGRTFGRSFA